LEGSQIRTLLRMSAVEDILAPKSRNSIRLQLGNCGGVHQAQIAQTTFQHARTIRLDKLKLGPPSKGLVFSAR
jgi:hypothetical protein